MMRFVRSLAGLAMLVGGIASTAQAAPGDHLKVGSTVITPSLRLGIEGLSNAFRSEATPQAAANFNFTPAVTVANAGPDFNFQLAASYTGRKFFYLADPEGLGDDVRRQQVKNLDRFNSFDGSVTIDAFRSRVVGLRLSDRAAVANNPNDGDIDGDHPYVSQIRNTLTGGIVARPGPAVEVDLAASWGWARFFVPSATSPREAFNTRNSYGPNLGVKWLFLPRTAFVFDASYRRNNWVEPSPSNELFVGIETPDSHFIRATTGLQGRITERLKAIVRIGYGAGIYDDFDGTNALGGLLATFQLTYELSDQHKIAAGYRKSFWDSFFTNVTQTNALYGRWDGKYGDRVTSQLRYGARFEQYVGFIERNDILHQLNGNVAVQTTPWMSLDVQGSWLGRRSTDDFIEYDDIRGGLGATFSY